MDLQSIATLTGAAWVCLGMAKAMSVSKAAQQQTTYVRFLFKDMGLTAQQVQEAGFERRLKFMESKFLVIPFCLLTVPYFLVKERFKFFADPPMSEVCQVAALTMRKCILENGKYVDILVKYEQKLIEQTTVH